MDLDGLRAFIAVVDTGSFSAAAKSLDFARTTLSKQVDELEKNSGVQLLKRAADGASVTRAGEIFAVKGRSLLKETKALFDAARGLEQQDDLLTLEVPMGLPPQVELTAHKAFRKTSPSLRWRIRYTSGEFNPDSDAHFVIHHGAQAGAPKSDSSRFHSTRIARLRTGLLASANYLKKNDTPQTVEDLNSHNLLVWERHNRDPHELPLVHAPAEPLRWRPSLISPHWYLVRQFAKAHQGIAYGPTSRIPGFMDNGGLVPVLPDEVRDSVDMFMSVRRDAEAGALGVLAGALSRFAAAAMTPLD